MGNCVTVARLALNQLVQVRILVPQLHFHPSKRLDSRRRPFGRRGAENALRYLGATAGAILRRCYLGWWVDALAAEATSGRLKGRAEDRSPDQPQATGRRDGV